MNNKYAPVLIPTLCRYEHFKRCIESLAKNFLAKKTIVYIALDYPLKEEHWSGYNHIIEYLNYINDYFSDLVIIKRDYNFGPYTNSRNAKEMLFSTYEKLIISEDDNVFAPNFLDYMNKGLDRYQNDTDVMAICGYLRPIKWKTENNNHFRLRVFSAWGYGIWRDRYYTFMNEFNCSWVYDELFNKMKVFDVFLKSSWRYNYLINSLYKGKLRLFDMNLISFMMLCKKFAIYPTKSVVKNYGFDGSGFLYKSDIKGFLRTELTTEKTFDFVGKDDFYLQENEKLLQEFYQQPKTSILKAFIKMIIILWRGKKGLK